MIVSSKENFVKIQVSSCFIRNENSVKLLVIRINDNLNFDYHVNQLCKKQVAKKLHTLATITKCVNINKRRMPMKRPLKLVYEISNSLKFQELLAEDKPVRVHQKNSQLLATLKLECVLN